jgi:replication factor C large subunit
MPEVSDWTERHRPTSERHLEGNEVQRRKIRAWLDDWQNSTPRKKAILLVGPPGVGKTSVARAIAQDLGWNVIELNASDARNAAAIRKAATQGSTHRSLFHDPNAKKQRTLILLDEVDHISGGLRAVSQDRIEKAMRGRDDRGNDIKLAGDSGGKAELLNLLAHTKQPVILACNEVMGLWGKGSSWRSTRDRFKPHLEIINFERASNEALRRIAKRVLREEELDFDDAAISALVQSNPGDLRALVRDLQVLSSTADGAITKSMVEAQADSGRRDSTLEVFPGLDALYRSNTAEEAVAFGRIIDKPPSELINWVHWNNASLFPEKPSIARANQTLSLGAKMLMAQYQNTAHRSWYWSGQLASLSASIPNKVPFRDRIYSSYPSFLRRQASWVRPAIVERLSQLSGSSKAAVRDELLPLVSAMVKDDPKIGDSTSFDLSIQLGFSGEEHASLAGLPLSRRSTKDLIAAYNERVEELASEPKPDGFQGPEVVEEPVEEEKKDDIGPASGQMKLF